MQVHFELHFSDRLNPQLIRTEFRCSLYPGTRISVRGKTAWRLGSTGSFENSKAVRALVKLMLLSADDQDGVLRGDSAKTLDYALGKRPMWVEEMFTDRASTLLFKRLFVRSNPEGKRVGPVEVSLNRAVWGKENIAFFLDGERYSPSAIRPLLNSQPRPNFQDFASRIIGEAVERELRHLLSLQNPFVASATYSLLNRYQSFARIQSLGGETLFHWLASYRPSRDSIDTAELCLRLQDGNPIEVYVAPANILGISLFLWLKHQWKLPIRLHPTAPTSFQQVHAIRHGRYLIPPDIIVAGLVPGVTLSAASSQNAYKYLFPMGLGTQSLLSSPKAQENSFAFFDQIPSNLELLLQTESRPGYEVSSASFAEVLRRTLAGELDQFVPAFAPFGCFLEKAGLTAFRPKHLRSEYMLFAAMASVSFSRSPRALLLEKAVRRAYTEVLMTPGSISKLVDLYISEQQVMIQITEESELYRLAS